MSRDEKPDINANLIAAQIKSEHGVIHLNGHFYLYQNGVYRKSENEITMIIKKITNGAFSTHLLREIKASLQAETFFESHMLGLASDYLNVKNGLFNLKSMELVDHQDAYHTIIQIPCDYLPEVNCEEWISFLTEVLGDEPEKIDILQEFFGYCLTPLTNQEKALILLGDGSNGKSVVLNVLEGLIGFENRAAVPLELFKNPHYLAELFGRMVNISTETNTKTQVYEATFKQLVSGETISADQKYGHPFTFKNTCKLIFAFNEFPRVDDKTDAYYRRIIPILFAKQIPESQQNKDLSRELLQEKSGILNWALKGLKRLQRQKGFSKSKSVNDLIADYRRDNNNVIGFFDDSCELSIDSICPKGDLYQKYRNYCAVNGFQPLSDKRFGKQLKKHSHAVTDDYGTDNIKLWRGIRAK